jgi:hypothetical protein
MAVESNLLGQQVRCPHCQQVVQTPAPAPVAWVAPPQDPAPVIFPSKEEESIFTPPPQDDLFGDPKPPPTLEMPAEAGWPASPAAAPSPPGLAFPDGPPDPTVGPSHGPTFSAPAPPDPLAFNTTTPAADPSDRTAVLPPTEWSSPISRETQLTPSPQEPGPPQERSPSRRVAAPVSLHSIMLIFLIPYAVFMTIMAAYFWFQSRQIISPLEQLPDEGEYRGVTKKGEGKISRYQERWKVDSTLSAKLRVPLGKTRRIGALEVTPERVARTPVTFCYDPARRNKEISREALVLTLRLKNVSTDQQFCPTDPYFDARWEDKKQPQPYTFLEMGSQKFFGGPIRSTGTKPKEREYVKGQENDPQPLGPGEQRTTVICTDPEHPEVLRALASYNGPLLWRVRLRRGLVEVRDKPRSATAVVGVAFSTSDIQ